MAGTGGRALRGLDARAAAVIRIDAVLLATQPLDMRAGTESELARVVQCYPHSLNRRDPSLPVRIRVTASFPPNRGVAKLTSAPSESPHPGESPLR